MAMTTNSSIKVNARSWVERVSPLRAAGWDGDDSAREVTRPTLEFIESRTPFLCQANFTPKLCNNSFKLVVKKMKFFVRGQRPQFRDRESKER